LCQDRDEGNFCPILLGFWLLKFLKKIGFFRKTAVIIGIIAVIVGILADNNIPVREQFEAIFAKQHCASWDVKCSLAKGAFQMHLRCETQFRPSRSQKHAPDPQAGQSLPDDILIAFRSEVNPSSLIGRNDGKAYAYQKEIFKKIVTFGEG